MLSLALAHVESKLFRWTRWTRLKNVWKIARAKKGLLFHESFLAWMFNPLTPVQTYETRILLYFTVLVYPYSFTQSLRSGHCLSGPCGGVELYLSWRPGRLRQRRCRFFGWHVEPQ